MLKPICSEKIFEFELDELSFIDEKKKEKKNRLKANDVGLFFRL